LFCSCQNIVWKRNENSFYMFHAQSTPKFSSASCQANTMFYQTTYLAQKISVETGSTKVVGVGGGGGGLRMEQLEFPPAARHGSAAGN
jgi:hypothetical protein